MINAFVHGYPVKPGGYCGLALKRSRFPVHIYKHILGYLFRIIYLLHHFQYGIEHPVLVFKDKSPECSCIVLEIQHVQFLSNNSSNICFLIVSRRGSKKLAEKEELIYSRNDLPA